MELIPLLRQAELLKRDSEPLRAKKERTEAAWNRLAMIKKTKLWPEFIELDDWVTKAIRERDFKDEKRFKRWRGLQIGLTDYIELAFTFSWVFDALKEAGYTDWQAHYKD